MSSEQDLIGGLWGSRASAGLVAAVSLHWGTPGSEARDFRDFTSTDGKTIHAELLEYEGESVRIRSKGRVFNIPIERLSEDDRTWLEEWDLMRRGDQDALYYKASIFEDDFSGKGFDEEWRHYKSESTIEEGVLVGKTIDIKDHAGVDSIRFEGKRDLQVALKFRFSGEEAQRFNLWFDDKDYKGSHAGHICSVTVSPKSLKISDAKTGSMLHSIREKRRSPEGLSEEQKKLLESKEAEFPLEIEKTKGEWHDLVVRTKGDEISVLVDGKVAGSFQSEGISHETKSVVSLTTYINDVHYDDFSVRSAKK